MNVASTTIEESGASADPSTQSAMNAVAAAMRDAASTATEPAAGSSTAIGDAGPWALPSLSRALYGISYMLSYGAVYAALFVVQSLPQGNAVSHGFHDGGAAARDALRRSG